VVAGGTGVEGRPTRASDTATSGGAFRPGVGIRFRREPRPDGLTDTRGQWTLRTVTVVTATSPEAGLEVLAEEDIDCVVSDYDMAEMNGLEFLDAVRAESVTVPFILFTGQGSEAIASEAISAGVTDYLQKSTSTNQYAVLANRIENAVLQHDAQNQVERARERFRKLVQHSTDVISIVDSDGRFQYLTPSAKRVLGYRPDELTDEVLLEHVHPEDLDRVTAALDRIRADDDTVPTVELRFDHPERDWIWVEIHARNMLSDPVVEGFVVHTRAIAERKRQTRRLERFVDIVSHDLRNALDVARGRLELFERTADREHLEHVTQSHGRIERIVDNLLRLAGEDPGVDCPDRVDLTAVAERAWGTVASNGATLVTESDVSIAADPDRLEHLLENVFRSAIERNGGNVTVRVGPLETADGFFVADDGTGLPEPVRESLFRPDTGGWSETRFEFAVVEQAAGAHDWDVSATESTGGGVRFEIVT